MKANPVAVHTEALFEGSEDLCQHDHRQATLAMRDAMNVLGGKWRIQLVGTLSLKGKQRFSDLLRELDGIGAKMLSKELHDLELNRLITRTVKQTKPLTVEYQMTNYGMTLKKLICEIISWGIGHREYIMKDNKIESDD